MCLGKQCRPRSDCCLVRVYTVCHSVRMVWTHYSMLEPHSSNFKVITTNILDVRIFRKFTVGLERAVTSLIWVCTVWPELSVWKLRIITVTVRHNLLKKCHYRIQTLHWQKMVWFIKWFRKFYVPFSNTCTSILRILKGHFGPSTLLLQA